jgi:cell wall-associated NlpC family hydrolase
MQLFVATNLTDLHREPSFLTEMLTQIFYGMRCEVLEERDKWCRVRMEDGYEGWAHRLFLTSDAPSPPTHIMASFTSSIRSEPLEDAPPISRLIVGTQIHVIEEINGMSRIEPVGEKLPGGWVETVRLRRLDDFPLSNETARRQVVSFARYLTGVYYLWGGNTSFGTDCSGLAWLAHRVCGHAIPRDSHPQFERGSPIEPPYQPGDLLFFHKETDPTRIGHVGISVGDWRMIHSSRSRNGVYEEDVQENPDLKRTFAGARAFIPR